MGLADECKNLLECAYYWEKNDPDSAYLIQPTGGGADNVQTWTWKKALNEARRMAAYLKSLDFPRSSHIALCSKNCAHWIMADLAIWMAGHVSIPVHPVLTPEIVQYTLEHSEARLLFVGKLDPIWDEMKKGVPDELPKIAFPLAPKNNHDKWDDIIARVQPLVDPVERFPGEVATIIYTSGSTGMPKGVMTSFEAMLHSVKGITSHMESKRQDRYLSYLPLSHAMERFIAEGTSLYMGAPLWFAESIDTFMQDLQRTRPTIFISVPRLWLKFQLGIFEKIPPKRLNLLFKIPILGGFIKMKILKELGLEHVRTAGSGSAPLPEDLFRWYRDLGLELLEAYGMTENFAYSHITQRGQERIGYVGTPYKDVEQKISPEGEILIKSPGNMMGYYKDPDATKAAFTEDGFLKTGDVGELDEMGRLKLTGRAKEQFKTSKGKYIAPTPIENLIASHHRVEICIVTGAGYDHPHAVVQLSEEANKELKNGAKQTITRELTELLGAVNSELPHFERLKFIAVTKDDWLPENGFLTPTLKIKRGVLEKAYRLLSDQWYKSNQAVVWQD